MGNVLSIICCCIKNKDNGYNEIDSNIIFEINNCYNCKQVFIRNKHTLLCDKCHNDWEIIV